MDTAENTQHHFRSSVMRPHSNLPRPGAFTSGLSEMNEAQSNARAHPSMIPPPGASKIGSLNSAMNLKREVPKPAEHSATKHHKTLAERAGEYPTKPSSAAAGAGASGIARAPSVRRVPGSTLAERPVSLDMAPESTTASSIVLRLDGLRTILWIAVHLFRSIRHIWRVVIQAVPRPFLWQRLLAFFPLPWHQNTLSRPRSRPRNGPSVPTPTYMRSVSGRLQLWLGLQSDGDNTRSGIRLLLDAEVQDAECYQTMECDDETDDRDELRCLKNPDNIRPRNGTTTSRYNQNSSFSASVGPRGHERAKSSLAHSKSVHGQSRTRNTNPHTRPRTAYGHRSEEEFDGPIEQQHGTALHSQRLNFLRPLEFQPSKARHASHTSQMHSHREVSLSSRFGALSIKDDASTTSSAQDEDQVVFSQYGGDTSVSSISTMASIAQVDNATMRAPSRRALTKPPDLSPKKRQASRMTDPVTPSPDSKRSRALMERLEETIIAIKDSRSPARSPSPSRLHFLTKDSNLTQFVGWDVEGRVAELDSQFKQVKESMTVMLSDKELMDERVEMYKKRISELEAERDKLEDRNGNFQNEINNMRDQMQKLTIESETEKRSHKYELEDEARKHRHELDELRRELKDETQRAEKSHREALDALERHFKAEIEEERHQKSREVQDLRTRLGHEQQDLNAVLQKKDREVSEMRGIVETLKGDLDREQSLKKGLEASISELSASNVTLEAKINSLKSHVEFLESDSKAQSDSFSNMEARLQEALKAAQVAEEKLIKEETERRVLFNKYQELKGNIRVMCRVRPVLSSSEGTPAKVTFPDEKTSAEIALQTQEVNSFGDVSNKNINFEFDRVFDPSAQNQDVFDEISQLVQSALDGYNVCIFCYGQTGSGKTHTMSSADGMIPRATHMIYDTVTKLKEKQWTYKMEGSFIEVYNEELNDLLTPNSRESDGRVRKLEIRHDDARKQTAVLNCKTVSLDSADTVEVMLAEAQNNRSVAATKANERSSRSHSVFILKLSGYNSATGERCEGTLNLVDLAGSERLKHSQAEGARMRETQNINKSLSCLGDVIEALGKKSGHIPYRNSKLTHLLQYSLGGNSKTLMFVMVSPLEAHLKETVTSLRFATKVHNTHIGTAKATKKA
ncbi:kinesin motor domain-containing protein [Colletotrichum abscissum]|uniref:Kinesin motor domain-containing protein n=1 Tax=Colletotrichum abscissum TaxID=1671311 RepID=A0A9Q0B246_9PEZI|nr:kinesin motor domain-containing protein [Colletotrichum abscissum]KAI3554370.1 kinesin motor domain-containing protein [Colletotrichum abscissum]KAK1505595.1 kinesin motor domain-containing protein [Colletotrichum abscissum]